MSDFAKSVLFYAKIFLSAEERVNITVSFYSSYHQDQLLHSSGNSAQHSKGAINWPVSPVKQMQVALVPDKIIQTNVDFLSQSEPVTHSK